VEGTKALMSAKLLDVEDLAAMEEIRRLEARYAYYADHKQWEDLAGLFTPDGWFRPLDAAGNQLSYMSGPADIAAQLRSRMTGDVQPIHQLFTHEIDIESPSSASAVWAMADLIFRGDGVTRGWGHYRVTYSKVDGQWLIATRTLTRTRLDIAD
jgi:hypothetical protein